MSLGSTTTEYTVYTNRKASEIAGSGHGTNPVTLGTMAKPSSTSSSWQYVGNLNWTTSNQEEYFLTATDGASTSASYGYRAGRYMDGSNTSGAREWLALGFLDRGGPCGLAYAFLGDGLTYAVWYYGARALGSGGNRGEYVAP